MLVCSLAMAVGTLLFGIDWGNPLLVFLLVVVSCFWCAAFFGMLNAFFRNKNQAGAFASPIILVFAAFGGSMLPLEQIPQGMRWLAQFTVNNWFITGCRTIVDGRRPHPLLHRAVGFRPRFRGRGHGRPAAPAQHLTPGKERS